MLSVGVGFRMTWSPEPFGLVTSSATGVVRTYPFELVEISGNWIVPVGYDHAACKVPMLSGLRYTVIGWPL